MNQLVAQNDSKQLEAYQEIVKSVPGWLGYLIGAYSGAFINPMTFPVFKDQFKEFPGEVLMDAARAWVESEKHFPYSPAEFKVSVTAFTPVDYHADFIRRMQRIGYQLVEDVNSQMIFDGPANTARINY